MDADVVIVEWLLRDRASELGAAIRRGHEVARVSQDDATAAADVRGPDGPCRVTARYLVGCDGAHSKVRDTAKAPPASPNSCTPRGPSSSASLAAGISARPPGTGSLASTSTRPAPITGQPMPC